MSQLREDNSHGININHCMEVLFNIHVHMPVKVQNQFDNSYCNAVSIITLNIRVSNFQFWQEKGIPCVGMGYVS